MNEPGPRFWEVFFEVYEHLPRQGPGNRACTARAPALCRDLPEAPAEGPEMHHRYTDFYAYEFFVARRPLKRRSAACAP